MLIEDLKKIVDGEVRSDDVTLETFSIDTSLFRVRPKAVVAPKNVEDIEALVKYVSEHKGEHPALSLTGRSGGTDMSGGPLSESIILNFTPHFTEFSVDEKALCAVVQPGVFYRDYEKVADSGGVLMPSYPASKSLCAWGGMIMNNAGGEKTLRYGQTREFVREVKMVLADGKEYSFGKLTKDELEKKKGLETFEGEVYRKMHALLQDNYEIVEKARPQSSKNAAGYALWDIWDKKTFDLAQLFVGSQGTLGILTEAKVRLMRKKQHAVLVAVFFDSWDEFPDVVNALLPCDPESLEVFDIETLKLGIRFMPEIAKKAGSRLVPFAMQFFPEAFIGLRMLGLPKLILLCEVAEETEEEARKKAGEIEKKLRDFHVLNRVIYDEKEAEKYWVMRRESFALLREHVKGKRTAPFIDDFGLDPKDIPEFLPEFVKILKRHHIKVNIAGHAGNGNLHIIPLMDLKDERERVKIPIVAEAVYELVLKHGGTITAEHNDGLIRSPFLKDMYGEEVYGLFEEVKKIFDPKNIFNPGKKVGSSLEYSMEHLRRD